LYLYNWTFIIKYYTLRVLHTSKIKERQDIFNKALNLPGYKCFDYFKRMNLFQRSIGRIIYKAETKNKSNINTTNNLNLIPIKLTYTCYFENIKFDSFVV